MNKISFMESISEIKFWIFRLQCDFYKNKNIWIGKQQNKNRQAQGLDPLGLKSDRGETAMSQTCCLLGWKLTVPAWVN